MKKVNVTFSIPVEVNELLHALVGRKQLSAFVSATLQKALEEKTHALKKAYAQAEKDPDRSKTIDDWQSLDIEGWE
ncbi:MAG: hypothetical protein WC707_02950 [Candidatus Babeliaceae bacterium]|jgi:hypothetical protein